MARPVVHRAAFVIALVASAHCAGSRRREAVTPAEHHPVPTATPPPPVAGVYAGPDRNTLTVTAPVSMPAQVVESSARLEVGDVTANSLRLTLVDQEEGARCALTASGGPSRWTLAAGQSCQHTRGSNVITLTLTGGTLEFAGENATLDFDATAEVAPATPNAAAPHVTGTASYHLAAQRGAAGADAGGSADASTTAGSSADAGAPGAGPDAGGGDASSADGGRRPRRGHGAATH